MLKVGIVGIDAISGEAFLSGRVGADPRDYVVIPDQPWLDGINAGDGFIRQFVAVPLGEGLTVEGQLTWAEKEGGLTLSLFSPRPGRFPDERPEPRFDEYKVMACAAPMGVGTGGRMRQEIYADEYGIETWEPAPSASVRIDPVDALAFEAITKLPTPRPVDARTYSEFGLPWFDLLDPSRRDIEAAERLASVRSVGDLTGRRDDQLTIPQEQVVRLLRLREQLA